ncbi:branched-chain amino acid ABC transporter permease [Chitinasiproducens palmae]|uniref:Amino acid/amide ABC transporter membrane protein 2, HAAT family n=1 Tax=Chitinasiproducens palmae TaxID=1770053 RepID=A0A1H2PTX9_9BURK|nr:branched-chain amino acid ABC transporter permease [Chitinasiproducens palmae]SDV50577.1 amino acid/amide ABC transporter membrane protein 2, HAAT family [Chitinasiproducens palmae]
MHPPPTALDSNAGAPRRAWHLRHWTGLLVLAVLIAALPFVMQSVYLLRLAALIWIMSLAALGLHVLTGMAGQVSLGHAGFFGISAYVVAILPARYNVPPLLAVAVAVLACGLLAFIIGKPILRLRGHYLAIATLGLSLLVALVITNEGALTGGPDGTSVLPLTIGELSVTGTRIWYWISGGLLLIGIALAICLRHSPTGRALCGLVDSEVAAAGMGIDIARRKLQAFVIAAVYAAVAGAALALMNGFLTPDVASFMNSVEFVAMVVVGGVSSPLGAVAGAAILSLLPQALATVPEYQDVVIGLIIMLSMIFLPNGIIPALARVWRQR